MLYLGLILQYTGKKILLADYSQTQEFINCCNHWDIQEGVIPYGNMDCVGKELELVDNMESYDIILVGFSFDYQKEMQGKQLDFGCFTNVFIVTDYRRQHILNTEEILEREDVEFQVIIRDVCSNRLNGFYFSKVYGKGRITEGKIHELYWDEVDYESRICMEYEMIHGIPRLSPSFQEFLVGQILTMGEMTYKDAAKLYKKAKKGDIF